MNKQKLSLKSVGFQNPSLKTSFQASKLSLTHQDEFETREKSDFLLTPPSNPTYLRRAMWEWWA